ncbi:unnamed protein product [Oppiella nova]|uniref:KATNIP domain-containing protein n=1 Tax=Oppiella nova TaxID=334625 RepID=A0A7R9M3H2_9ACAR|nr:unnamed protein product [Oppiella nova]CAG2170056.1 unnamed protein product [Oppiella nova]
MSYLTPLSTIELNLRQTKDKPNSDENLSMSPLKMKKLPKWLLEFESFSVNDTKFKNETNARPLTESSVTQRPQWFQELAQQRRSSDAFTAVDTNSDLFSTTNEKIDFSESDDTITRRRGSLQTQDNPYLIDGHITAKSVVSIPKELKNYSESQVKRTSLENSFKSCDNLLYGMDDSFSDFIIPELPFGQQLVFEIVSNWGDEDFVGLNGIEIIDLNGSNFKIKKIWSEPQINGDLNALIDGVYRTHDDSHIWSTELKINSRLPVKIFIQFESNVSIALIRIWNYNKSRIYSYRGIKFLSICLDRKLIFKGEIAKASGNLIAPIEAFGDTILFTTNEDILESVALRDHSFQELVNEIIPLTQQ